MKAPLYCLIYFTLSPPILLLLLITALSSVHSYIIVTDFNSTKFVSFHTIDYFQQPSPYYEDVLCILTSAKATSKKDCSFEPVQKTNVPAQTAPKYTCGIVYLTWQEADTAGCGTVAGASKGILQSVVPTFKDAGFTNITQNMVSLVVGLPWSVPGAEGGPATTPYLSHGLLTPDYEPKMETVFIKYNDALVFNGRFGQYPTDLISNIVKETGDWNAVYLSLGYRIFSWLWFALNAGVFVAALGRFLQALRLQQFNPLNWNHPEQPSNIYFLTLVSTALYTSLLMLRRQTQTFYLLEYFSSFIHYTAFYYLVVLWIRTLAREQRLNEKQVLGFRFLTWFSILIHILGLFVNMLWLFTWPGKTLSNVRNIFKYIMPSTLLLLTFYFGFHLVRFYLWKRQREGILIAGYSDYHHVGFFKLSALIISVLFALIVKYMASVVSSDIRVATSVAGMTVLFFITDAMSLIRVAAMFCLVTFCVRKGTGSRLFDGLIQNAANVGGARRNWTQIPSQDTEEDDKQQWYSMRNFVNNRGLASMFKRSE